MSKTPIFLPRLNWRVFRAAYVWQDKVTLHYGIYCGGHQWRIAPEAMHEDRENIIRECMRVACARRLRGEGDG